MIQPRNRDWLAAGAVVTAILVAALAWRLVVPTKPAGGAASPLRVLCAASQRQALEQLAAAFTDEFGVQVELHYGGSQTLLAQLEAGGPADVFVPADELYAVAAHERGLASAPKRVATMRAVILAQAGNPLQLETWRDLLGADVRVSLADPAQAAIGQLVQQALGGPTGAEWLRLGDHIARRGVFKPTVADAANDVAAGTADAAIVWDVVARQHAELATIVDPELHAVVGAAAATTCTASQNPPAAARFVEFLTQPVPGRAVFARAGYGPPDAADSK